MAHLVGQFPASAIWAGFRISRKQIPTVAQALLLGGHVCVGLIVCVGLVHKLYHECGVFASNDQLIDKPVGNITALGARPVSPAEARAKPGLAHR